MKKLLYIFLLFPLASLADPSVSSDSSRSYDSSASGAMKRDKNLSVDKSSGGRHALSNSRDRAREESVSESESRKASLSSDSSQSSSVELNINTMLIKQFVARYEAVAPDESMSDAQQVFGKCKPITGLVSEYPILNSTYRWYGPNLGHDVDLDDIAPYRIANRFAEEVDSAFGGPHGNGGAVGGVKKYTMNPESKYIGQFARCRILASWWLAHAGDAVSVGVVDANEHIIERQIDEQFIAMDKDSDLFKSLVADAKALWLNAQCSPTLVHFSNFDQPNMRCQIFSVIGDQVMVNGRETLSANSIEGRSYKVSLSASEAASLAVDNTKSTDLKDSRSIRLSESRELYRERKKSASMSTSKSSDHTVSSKVGRSAGTSMSAAPKE